MHSNLFLNRLIIYTLEGEVAFDEIFHRGINIINGDNSSGKSTITQFIFYILGGAFNDWVREAKLCSSVFAEVEMNGALMSLRRSINININTGKANSSEPIHIFWGNIEMALLSANEGWNKFNYNTTSEKKSFSNVFFENLNIPIVKEENNITFHQILRLLYVDQDSPTSSLFLYEQFDTTLTRETVSDLLLGVYSDLLYDSKLRKIDASKEFDDVKKEIKIIKQFVSDEFSLHPTNVLQKIENKEKELLEIELEIVRLREENKLVRYTKSTKLGFQSINETIIGQRKIVSDLETQIGSLKYEIYDTEYFLNVLDGKLRAVKNSISTREVLGNFPLDLCPECLTELKPVSGSNCKLCKEPIDQSFGISQARKVEQEIGFQLQESRGILKGNKRKLLELESKFESESVKLRQLQVQINSALNDVKSVRDEKIDSLYVDKGFIEGELAQLRSLLENAELYQKLTQRRDTLEIEIASLDHTIDRIVIEQAVTKRDINASIEKMGLYLLNNDLQRQQDFVAAREFNIDYRNNLAFISDKGAKYSASSNFYLKVAARFAIFLASLSNARMRYPRFLLCDNMEDKGIEQQRAYNFQRIIISELAKYNPLDYQLIYTTSNLPPEMAGSDYLIGHYYSKENPSLLI